MKKLTSTWAVVVTVIILIGLKLYNPLPLQSLQLKTFDYYQTFGTQYDSKSIVLLDISDLALEKKGQWPWKRDQVGRAVINAYKNGAALVVLQLVFTQKDRLGGDEMFLKMITKYPVILTETKDAKNLLSIKRKALAIGDVEVPIDVDGTIRKLPLDNSVPSVILQSIFFATEAKDEIWIDFSHPFGGYGGTLNLTDPHFTNHISFIAHHTAGINAQSNFTIGRIGPSLTHFN